MSYSKTTWIDNVTPVSATNLNNIEDAIESERTYPVAGGTGAIITVTAYHFTLAEGVSLTFIAAHNNYGGSTTINVNGTGTRGVYKPGGTSAPTFVAGKAYTLWYDTSSGHFFLKASAVVDDTTPQLGGELDCQSHTVGFTETDNGNSGTAKAIDWRLSNHQKVTMTGNCVFTFIAPTKPAALTLITINDATAGRTITLPTVKWVGGIAPVWTKTANSIDFLQLYWNGTFYIGQAALNCV